MSAKQALKRPSLGAALVGAAVLGLLAAPIVEATPSRIIILRHGEKLDAYKLCAAGQQRSLALRANYLGKNAASSLFATGQEPAGFFAITLHTLELISPAAQSWGLPLQLYSVVPLPHLGKQEVLQQLNLRTQQAAQDVFNHPRWDGKTVVMAWEHDHIANQALENKFPQEKVTLRQLLNLDALPQVPQTWPGDNYDYFWIVDYDTPGSATPTRFTAMKQVFPAPYQSVPSNDWGKPEKASLRAGCMH